VKRPELAVLALLSLMPSSAHALDNGITIYAGRRFGGSFQEVNTDANLKLGESSAFSAAIDFGVDAARQIELFISRQNTTLSLADGSSLPIRISMVHIGGTNFFERPSGAIGRGPYVLGGIGLTRLDPGLFGYSAEMRPSLNLGLGWMQPLGSRFAARIEARTYQTLVNSSGSLFCSGGCTLQIKGDVLRQGEVLVGITARF
jgi:hypothetical protein